MTGSERRAWEISPLSSVRHGVAVHGRFARNDIDGWLQDGRRVDDNSPRAEHESLAPPRSVRLEMPHSDQTNEYQDVLTFGMR